MEWCVEPEDAELGVLFSTPRLLRPVFDSVCCMTNCLLNKSTPSNWISFLPIIKFVGQQFKQCDTIFQDHAMRCIHDTRS